MRWRNAETDCSASLHDILSHQLVCSGCLCGRWTHGGRNQVLARLVPGRSSLGNQQTYHWIMAQIFVSCILLSHLGGRMTILQLCIHNGPRPLLCQMVTQQIKNTAEEQKLVASASMCFALECSVLSRKESLALFCQWWIGRPRVLECDSVWEASRMQWSARLLPGSAWAQRLWTFVNHRDIFQDSLWYSDVLGLVWISKVPSLIPSVKTWICSLLPMHKQSRFRCVSPGFSVPASLQVSLRTSLCDSRAGELLPCCASG